VIGGLLLASVSFGAGLRDDAAQVGVGAPGMVAGGSVVTFQRRHGQIDDALADGEIAEEEWYERNRKYLETAYLARNDPQGQSGLGGDAAHWERRRRVIVEAIDRDGTFLDVGCANGLLMETMVTWAATRGIRIEPYGLEISPRLAALAQARLPGWAHRIYVGNAIDWEPPRQFDYVRTELVYVPAARQPQLVAHLLERAVAPGGRLIACAYREVGTKDALPIRASLHAWGFAVNGEAIATDSDDGGVATRVVWLDSACRRLST
jgi:SAM-dependent methyltransferase